MANGARRFHVLLFGEFEQALLLALAINDEGDNDCDRRCGAGKQEEADKSEHDPFAPRVSPSFHRERSGRDRALSDLMESGRRLYPFGLCNFRVAK